MSEPTFTLYDLGATDSATLGQWTANSIEVTHNQGRKFSVTVPMTAAFGSTTLSDGFPLIETGDRKLVVSWNSTTPIHARVMMNEYSGDGTTNQVTLTAMDVWAELGFEAGGAGRLVRDATGNFISPSFNSDGPIRGGDLVEQILTNSIVVGGENPGPGGEGPLPIDLSLSTFDTSVPGATDATNLSPAGFTDWPQMVGDFLTSITETGVTDINFTPLAIGDSADDYAMVSCEAVDTAGTDLSGSVHFDYWTGSNNCSSARYTEDFSIYCSKLYDYLGIPSLTHPNRWPGNITPTAPAVGETWDAPFLAAIAASRARYGGPGADPGTFMQFRAFDQIGTENFHRRLYIGLFREELSLRLNPRKLLYLVPQPGSAALFEPFVDYNVSDLVTVNVGGDFGVDIAATQRVMGIRAHWDVSGVLVVDQLLTTADAG